MRQRRISGPSRRGLGASAANEAAQSSAMPDERRVVTVLFSDVAGSTALGEELDPEDLRALMARYYAIAKDVVADHGGTLEKFIGYSSIADFALPQPHGDEAVR